MGGDAARATLHCRRGFATPASREVRCLLAYEAFCLLEARRAPARVGEALDALTGAQRIDSARRFFASTPAPPPITIAARTDPRFLGGPGEGDLIFSRDFLLSGEDLYTFLRADRPVWSAASSRPEVLARLYEAVDDADPIIRARALAAFDDKTLDSEPVAESGVAALLARLDDDTFRTVRDAGSVLRQIVAQDARHHDRVCAPWSSVSCRAGSTTRRRKGTSSASSGRSHRRR